MRSLAGAAFQRQCRDAWPACGVGSLLCIGPGAALRSHALPGPSSPAASGSVPGFLINTAVPQGSAGVHLTLHSKLFYVWLQPISRIPTFPSKLSYSEKSNRFPHYYGSLDFIAASLWPTHSRLINSH